MVMRNKNKSLLIFAITFIIIGFLQHFYIRRAGHYIPDFDVIDAFFFGLGFIGFAVGSLRFFQENNIRT